MKRMNPIAQGARQMYPSSASRRLADGRPKTSRRGERVVDRAWAGGRFMRALRRLLLLTDVAELQNVLHRLDGLVDALIDRHFVEPDVRQILLDRVGHLAATQVPRQILRPPVAELVFDDPDAG